MICAKNLSLLSWKLDKFITVKNPYCENANLVKVVWLDYFKVIKIQTWLKSYFFLNLKFVIKNLFKNKNHKIIKRYKILNPDGIHILLKELIENFPHETIDFLKDKNKEINKFLEVIFFLFFVI